MCWPFTYTPKTPPRQIRSAAVVPVGQRRSPRQGGKSVHKAPKAVESRRRRVLKSPPRGSFRAMAIPKRIPNYHLHLCQLVCDQGIYSHFKLYRNEMRSQPFFWGTMPCLPGKYEWHLSLPFWPIHISTALHSSITKSLLFLSPGVPPTGSQCISTSQIYHPVVCLPFKSSLVLAVYVIFWPLGIFWTT